MTANRQKLLKIFNSLDQDGDKVLNVAEVMKAFEKGAGQKPTLAQVQGFIKEVDTNNDNAIDFEEFVVMVERVNRGELPRSTGIPSLITDAWEELIQNQNKPVEKNKPVAKLGGKGGGVVNPEKPQGEIYKLEKKGPKRVIYNNLPEKKNLQDLL